MKYPVLSAISPDKSLQVASSPSFQIIFMVHPHIFLIEAPFFHHPLVMSSLLENPIGVGLFKVRTQQFSKLFWVNFCHTSTLNPYINLHKIYMNLMFGQLKSPIFHLFHQIFLIIFPSFFGGFPDFVTGFGTRCFSSGGREEFRCDIIETPTQYDGVGCSVLGESQP